MTQHRRGIAVTALLAVTAMLVALVTFTPNAEATSYRYWTYWVGGDGDWTFSSQGASRVPADGTVEGWRFSISQAAGSSATPRVTSDFDAICSGTNAVDGKKRVGLVLDFGVKADAPPGANPPDGPIARCLVLPVTASGYDVLVAATSIRVEKGMVCGVAGYPKSGCGEPVASPHPTPDPSGGSGTPPGNGGGNNGDHQSPGPDNGSATNPGGGSNSNPGDLATSPSDSPSKKPSNDNKHDKPKPNNSSDDGQGQPPAGIGEAPVSASDALNASLPTTTDNSNSPTGMLLGLGAVAALAVAGVVVARRRR